MTSLKCWLFAGGAERPGAWKRGSSGFGASETGRSGATGWDGAAASQTGEHAGRDQEQVAGGER